MGSTSRPPRERGVNMRNNPVSYSASRTGRERWRSRSASPLCSRITGAMRRAASMNVVSALVFIASSFCEGRPYLPSISQRSWHNIGVQTKDIHRIVLTFQCRKPLVIGTKRRAYLLRPIVAGKVIHVGAPGNQRLETAPECTRPGDLGVRLPLFCPLGDDVEIPLLLAQSEGRRCAGHTGRRAMYTEEDHSREW